MRRLSRVAEEPRCYGVHAFGCCLGFQNARHDFGGMDSDAGDSCNFWCLVPARLGVVKLLVPRIAALMLKVL